MSFGFQDRLISRRQMLRRFGNGFGMLGLAGLFGQELLSASNNPLAVKVPHFAPKAKRIIFLFMSGGPSHVDTFDPKPALAKYNGQKPPFELPKLERTRTGNILQSPFSFKKYGQSGAEVSELFPNIAGVVDELCIVRSMMADNINHNGACLQMNTGEQAFSRPSLGSWLLYGLGSENQSLPGFVVISPSQPPREPRCGVPVSCPLHIRGPWSPISQSPSPIWRTLDFPSQNNAVNWIC
jgi:hypothetical protein